ncbi:futalosine hydrolase [Streptomyces sp. TP-A0874]|uniref:futalosine hydrolase n=1 Tax=Streptomyces sp. TP-A0874 TaxID=549819 RepID=UPI0008536919|nr:futalosine hydrolase [Streptomyces sp. TP-A0874]
MTRVLVVTAVTAEAEAVGAGLRSRLPAVRPEPLPGGRSLLRYSAGPEAAAGPLVDVLAAGVGPSAAAAGAAGALTAASLAGSPYRLVLSAGIGGGFATGPGHRPHAPVGSVVLAEPIVAADLGAETPEGYLSVDELGFGRSAHPPPAGLTGRFREALAGHPEPVLAAPVLTVSTVTGSARRAAELSDRHPGAGAEAMEGFGVAEAAAAHGLPVSELRTISNPVGPRDRDAWQIGRALESLRLAFQLLTPAIIEEDPR